ncbi:MAG: FAD-dependent monooxygenase, partial [Pseudomonadota bacterium]
MTEHTGQGKTVASDLAPDLAPDIAIVGAGPVGLLAAILLGRQGHSVLLVEKWPQIYPRPRAVTMDAEVARILASLGIDCDTDPAFENHKELYYWKNADLQNLQIVDWESLAPCGWHVTYWFNQPALEAR